MHYYIDRFFSTLVADHDRGNYLPEIFSAKCVLQIDTHP